MKVETITVQTRNIYIAKDGERFNSERECLEYERLLDYKDVPMPDFVRLTVPAEDYTVCVAKLESRTDFDRLQAEYTQYCDAYFDVPKSYPCFYAYYDDDNNRCAGSIERDVRTLINWYQEPAEKLITWYHRKLRELAACDETEI